MYLIITAIAAIVTTIIWYVKAPDDKYKISRLCLMYWGATLMWLVDHIMAYLTEGGEFFEVTLNATLLGIVVVLFGLLIWTIMLLIKDPKDVFKNIFQSKV